MQDALRHKLEAMMHTGGAAYVRNLAAAELAVERGQFNLAKVLRATAHTQRVIAMHAARLLAETWDPPQLLALMANELAGGSLQQVDGADTPDLERLTSVAQVAEQLIQRAIASLTGHRDVREDDIAQFVCGCYSCGLLVEGAPPDSCPNCGALGIEFAVFGPFYATTPEHLGQLQPEAIVATLAGIPKQVAAAVAGVPEAALRRKPAPNEWCVNEIIGHMLETDQLFVWRVQVLRDTPGVPELPRPAPPWKLHEGKGYEVLETDEIVHRLRLACQATLKLLSTLTVEDWIRQGLLQEGRITLLDLGTWIANHDRGHLAQIQALCQEHQQDAQRTQNQ
jgi:rubrerythrin